MAPSRLPSGRMACAPWRPWMLTGDAGPTAPPQVYEDTSALVVSCIDGYNVAIIAYGQTGSGKVWLLFPLHAQLLAATVVCPPGSPLASLLMTMWLFSPIPDALLVFWPGFHLRDRRTR